MEKGFEQSQEELETCASKIIAWELQLEEPHTKIKKAKERQEEIQKLDREELENEIQVGVDHFERAQALGKDIDILNSNQYVIDRRLSLSKMKYERMKNALLFSLFFLLML